MAITKEKKQEILKDLRDKISKQKSIVLIGISGLKVKDLSILRKQLKENGSELKVVKKNLASLALKENKLIGDEAKPSSSSSLGEEDKSSSSSSIFDKDIFKTEIGFVFGFEDEILPAKTIYKFSKTNENLQILGGFIEGLYKDGAEVTVLAQLPSRQELIGRMIGSLSAPVSGFVNVLQGNIKGLVLALNAISKNK